MRELQQGVLEIIAGPMAAGKSQELIRRIRRALVARKKVQVFKPAMDSRYFGINRISTHDGVAVDATPIRFADDILHHLDSDTEVVAVDEVQFFTDEIVVVLNSLADEGVRVIAAGTDIDFRGEPFGAMGMLMVVADRVDKLSAICVCCGGEATRNQRLVDGRPALYDDPVIQVGGLESYESRCRHCHEVPTSADALPEGSLLPFDTLEDADGED
jgi:thymidine kinase